MQFRLVWATGVAACLGLAMPAATVASSGRIPEYVAASGSDTLPGGAANPCTDQSMPCALIQTAIDRASNGPTVVYVAAGDYPEQLVIAGKRITIEGDGRNATIIDPASLVTTNDDPGSSAEAEAVIVDVTDGSTGGLRELTVEGSQASVAGPVCAKKFVGVQFANSEGEMNAVDIDGPNELSQSPCAPIGGTGVYVAGNTNAAQPVAVTEAGISGYGATGVDCETPQVSCDLQVDEVEGPDTGATNGVVLGGIANGFVAATKVRENRGTPLPSGGSDDAFGTGYGVLAFGDRHVVVGYDVVSSNDINVLAAKLGPRPSAIGSNKIADGGRGIDIEDSEGVEVVGNTVRDNDDGVRLNGDRSLEIGGHGQRNVITHNQDDGIVVDGTAQNETTHTTIAGNDIDGNGSDGILAVGADANGEPQEGGNIFLNNHLDNNDGISAEDQSSGGGTAGTANTWTGNLCPGGRPSSPAGLCDAHPGVERGLPVDR
jgi:hypothetical protein